MEVKRGLGRKRAERGFILCFAEKLSHLTFGDLCESLIKFEGELVAVGEFLYAFLEIGPQLYGYFYVVEGAVILVSAFLFELEIALQYT